MEPSEALGRARSEGTLEVGTFSFAELDAVGFPPPRNYVAPSETEVLAARTDLVSRGLAEVVEPDLPLRPLGGLGLWQTLNAETRSVLVCLAGLAPDETQPPAHDLTVSVLPDDDGPALALTVESAPNGRAFGLTTLPPVGDRVTGLVFAEDGSPMTLAQLFFVRPTRKGGRDVIEARFERSRGQATARVHEMRTGKRFKIAHLAPAASADQLRRWLAELMTTRW